MNISIYQHLTTENFLEDEYFREWVFNPNAESITFWNQVILSYPEQESEILTAKDLLMGIHNKFETDIQQISKKQAKVSLQKVLDKTTKPAKVVNIRRRSWLAWTAAASVLVLMSIASFLHFSKDFNQLTFTTGNGKRQVIQLPDGSKVQLNANSTLHYFPDNWWDKEERQVWLDGEAFFEVEKKALGTKFIVHAGDLKVAVLGTQFNVRSRGEEAEVVLTEGQVELDVEAQKIRMQPGDLVSYSKKKHKVATKKVKTADYVAWKDGITVFNNTLSEVVKELEIIYGVKFQIQKEALKARKIQLSVPTNSLEQVLETLELLYPEEISISQENGAVVIF